jgi:EmrB/QacA subfamily drug resistance transporter
MSLNNTDAVAGSRRAPGYLLLLTTVCLGGILAPLNSTMLAVALPELRREFDVGHAEIGWLVSAYLIAMAVAQPLGGRIGDQLGRARVFRFGLLAFLAFSIAAAFAPTFLVLVLLRTGQALVGAAVIPNGMGMLRESLPVKRLGRSAGLTGSAIALAAATGPLLGAELLEVWSWRLLFLVNIPMVAAALASLALLKYQDAPGRQLPQIDWAGAVVFAGALTSLTFLLDSLRGAGLIALVAAAGVLGVLTALFVHRQRTSPMPIAEWRLFRVRSYAAATLYVLLANLVMYTTLLTLPFFLEELQGRSHHETGLLLSAMAILMAAVTPISGRASDRYGRRVFAVAGGAITLGGITVIVAGIDTDVSYGYLAIAMALLGLGNGMSFGAAATAAAESAPVEMAGVAAGMNSMMRYVGSIIGAGILGAVLTESAAEDAGLFQLIFAILTALAAAGFVTAFFIHRFPPEQARSVAATPSAALSGARAVALGRVAPTND